MFYRQDGTHSANVSDIHADVRLALSGGTMSKQARAVLLLGTALYVGAVAHQVADQQALVLGISGLELFLLAAAAGAAIKRAGLV